MQEDHESTWLPTFPTYVQMATAVANMLVLNPTLQRDVSTVTPLMKNVTTLAQFAQGTGMTISFQCIVQVLLHSLST